MNEDLRQTLTAIKAALRIGHSESLDIALDSFIELPQVAGNPLMSHEFINQAVLPIGRLLSGSPLLKQLQQDMLESQYAAIRAISGAALAYGVFNGKDTDGRGLQKLAGDSREDVRLALQLAMTEAGADKPDQMAALCREWLAQPSPRLQATALSLLPMVPGQAMGMIESMETPNDPLVRAALSESLAVLAAQDQAEAVLQLLHSWAALGEVHAWVVCKTLAYSWAAESANEALAVIEKLAGQIGPEKQVKNTLEAIARHGAEPQVHEKLLDWRDSRQPQLQAVASVMLAPE